MRCLPCHFGPDSTRWAICAVSGKWAKCPITGEFSAIDRRLPARLRPHSHRLERAGVAGTGPANSHSGFAHARCPPLRTRRRRPVDPDLSELPETSGRSLDHVATGAMARHLAITGRASAPARPAVGCGHASRLPRSVPRPDLRSGPRRASTRRCPRRAAPSATARAM